MITTLLHVTTGDMQGAREGPLRAAAAADQARSTAAGERGLETDLGDEEGGSERKEPGLGHMSGLGS